MTVRQSFRWRFAAQLVAVGIALTMACCSSAGAAYFVPLADDIVEAMPTWQVWSVERRQNLLEDQSELDRFKSQKSSNQELFDYYLGYIGDDSITDHVESVPNDDVGFAKQWGLAVVVEDLRIVVDKATELGGKVVLGGHSLGGSVTTAYATWDFDGHPGADQLNVSSTSMAAADPMR